MTTRVYKRFGYFYSGHEGTTDAKLCGRPVEVTTAENITKSVVGGQTFVNANTIRQVREIANTTDISNELGYNILHEHLHT